MGKYAMEPEEPDRSAEIEMERLAIQQLKGLAEYVADELADNLSMLWVWGDGEGGYVLEVIKKAVYNRMGWSDDQSSTSTARTRKAISASTRKTVFERDAYRCVKCSGYIDLCVDHIHPWSKGGPDELDNFQTLCRSCNAKKRDRIEVIV